MKLDAETSAKIAGFGLICAFFVALLHVPQPMPVDTSTPAWWLFHLTAETFGRLGVPFYFVAAGFFLARHYGESSWWCRETSKRMASLLVPFVVWLALWNAEEGALAVLSNLRSGAPLSEGFPSGGALLSRLGINPFDYPSDIPLWFLRSLLLYVVASCALFPALKRTGPLLPATVLVLSMALRLSDGSSEACRFLSRFVSLHGLFYFLVGASLALGVLRMPARNILFAFAGAAGAVGLFASQFLAARNIVWWGGLHELSLPLALLAAWRVFPSVSWPRSLTSLTFPVYVLHVLVIRALDVVMYGDTSCAGIVVKYAAVSALTLAAAAAIRKFLPRCHSFLFGGR